MKSKQKLRRKKVNPPATDIAWVQKTARQYTVLLEEELRAAITDGIPLEHLETICAAYKDGRLMTLPKHRLANGSKAWTIDQYGDIQEGTISYCTSEYSMYFACKVCGFPFMNSDIGKIVFQTRLKAETALVKDMPHTCETCKFYDGLSLHTLKKDIPASCKGCCPVDDKWEWVGSQKGEDHMDGN